MAKKSVSQRKDDKATRTYMYVGGAVFAGVVAIGGYFMSKPYEYPRVGGTGSIESRMQAGGYAEYAIDVVDGKGATDILVLGSSDCGHCEKFVNKGLDALVDYAKAEGLSVKYFPMASGKGSLSVGKLLSCMSPDGKGQEALKASYVASKAVSRGTPIMDAVMRQSAAVGFDLNDVKACEERPDAQYTSHMQSAATEFGLQGTPHFVVTDKSGELKWFGGFANAGGMINQIKSIRE